jgi:hypothetical protein
VARTGALAQEVDAVAAQRSARGLEIVDSPREAVVGEINAVVHKPLRAGSVTVGVCAEGFFA